MDVAEGLHHYIRLLIMEYKADYARVHYSFTEKRPFNQSFLTQ
jgi:hypothetical protein